MISSTLSAKPGLNWLQYSHIVGRLSAASLVVFAPSSIVLVLHYIGFWLQDVLYASTWVHPLWVFPVLGCFCMIGSFACVCYSPGAIPASLCNPVVIDKPLGFVQESVQRLVLLRFVRLCLTLTQQQGLLLLAVARTACQAAARADAHQSCSVCSS